MLSCVAGERNDAIGARMGLQANTVATSRKRFLAHGMAGFQDRPRSGMPPKYAPSELRERILKQLELPAPEGQSSWDGATLAAALTVSEDAVWRILRKEGIQLQRMRSWCVSTDPEFAAKADDVIGLYLGAPSNAIVLSVDGSHRYRHCREKRATSKPAAARSCVASKAHTNATARSISLLR